MNVKEELIQICMDFSIPKDINVVISKPYIPWIPEDWNGTLVLAEAQNLSSQNVQYVDYLKRLSDYDKIDRLNNSGNKEDLGIAPWDDGSLKLVIEAAFNENADKVAVSNAVMWSQVSNSNVNMNPDNNLCLLSSELWSLLLPVFNPNKIITAGKIAENVISYIKLNYDHVGLRLPSKTAMSRISGMFNKEDLLKRYPEVKDSVTRHPEWVEKYTLNKIFYACHAVSLYAKKD